MELHPDVMESVLGPVLFDLFIGEGWGHWVHPQYVCRWHQAGGSVDLPEGRKALQNNLHRLRTAGWSSTQLDIGIFTLTTYLNPFYITTSSSWIPAPFLLQQIAWIFRNIQDNTLKYWFKFLLLVTTTVKAVNKQEMRTPWKYSALAILVKY